MPQSYRYPNLEFDIKRSATDEPIPVSRYTRTNFIGAGTDNFAQPPSQDPEMMMQLLNCQPIVDGVIKKRWGYSLWANPGITPSEFLYDYQNDVTAQRNIILSQTSTVQVRNDDGSLYNNQLFVPNPAAITAPREVTSRSYAYFSDGQATDYLKWNGATSGGVTKWGIDVNNVTGSGTTIGPDGPTIAVDAGYAGGSAQTNALFPTAAANQIVTGNSEWMDVTNIFATDGNYAFAFLTNTFSDPSHAVTRYLYASAFGFTLPASAAVTGVTVNAVNEADPDVWDNSVKLIKAGTVGGTEHATTTGWGSTTQTWGNSTDTWGFTLVGSDVNNSTFGVALSVENVSILTSRTVHLDSITITVTYSLAGVPTWSNPNAIFAPDGFTANSTVTTSGTGELQATGFGFAVPAGGVQGIKVEVLCSSVYGIVPHAVPITLRGTLLNGGSPQGAQRTIPVNSASLTYVTLGGSTDGWGATLSYTDINASSFGVQLDAVVASGTGGIQVDYVRITVYTGLGPLALGSPGSGSITLVSGRIYYIVFENSLTGHYSDLNPPSDSTGPLTNNDQPLSGIPVSADPQVDTVVILATADGGDETQLYLLVALPNGTTSYIDNTDELTLLAQPLLLSTDVNGTEYGVSNNDPPPNGYLYPTVYNGAIYMVQGSNLRWSKTLTDITTASGFIAGKWEEAWPPANSADISATAETPRGMLTDGVNLYIGTEYRIRTLNSNITGLDNPAVVHNDVGILNQDVWKIIYTEGMPSGAIWMTPDNRMVIGDFNTYKDIGTPIQTTLNTINAAIASSTARAEFYANGPFDLYMIAFPTGSSTVNDTVAVLNLRTLSWVIWNLTDTITAMLGQFIVTGAPQLLLASNTGKIYSITPYSTQDRIHDFTSPLLGSLPLITNYTSVAQTSWLDLQDPAMSKSLNEVEIQTDDVALLVTVEGASTREDFAAPNVIAYQQPVKLSPLGEYKVFLASAWSGYRYYRLTFTTSNPVVTVVGGFNIEAVPLNRI